MTALEKPTPFAPGSGQPADVRAAEALEFIAHRMSGIEYHLEELRLRLMKLETAVKSLVQPRPPRRLAKKRR